jgi:sigma-E factor negative regulatory protein RseA
LSSRWRLSGEKGQKLQVGIKVVKMNERMRESLSALLDDEANEMELQRLLQSADDDELRHIWGRYNIARDVASGQQLAHLNLDVSKRVQSALAETRASDLMPLRSFKQRVLRPLTSLAVAASVAATVVVGGQQLAQVGESTHGGERAFAVSASPVGMVNSLGATTVQASYGTRALPVLLPATRTAYEQLARQRMGRYMQEHAEHAALNSPQGLIPFARVPQIRE